MNIHDDLSILPRDLAERAVAVGNDTCWPLECAPAVIHKLAKCDQIILGAEVWHLPGGQIDGGRTLDITWYIAEKYLTSPEGLVASCRDLALEFVNQVTRKRDIYIQIGWVSWADWNELKTRPAL